jgi:outer membrane beta-barrel protein
MYKLFPSLFANHARTALVSGALLALASFVPNEASAQDSDSPGLDALDAFRGPRPTPPVIANRFFVKEERFEVTPYFGYVPNNPFVVRYAGGLMVGYHFNEQFSAQGQLYYAPDLGESDLKGLTRALVTIAHTGPGGANFQQPLDKPTLSAGFSGSWAPIYGKINLIGETVLSFDLYGTAGLGMISKVNYFAVYDDAAEDLTSLEKVGNEVKLAPSIGFGLNIFVNQTVALKLDTRFNFYVDNVPQYDEDVPVDGQRLYNVFVASGGVSFFFPNMKRRVFDF